MCVGVLCFWPQAVFFASCGPISKLPPLASEEVDAERRKQQVDHIRDYFAQRGRLNNVAFRIRVANHHDCKIRSAQIGLDAGTVHSLPRKFRSYSHEALSVSWTRATVLSVAEASPAAAGGIKPGDQILTFNNEAVPGSETAEWVSRFVRTNGERPIHVLVRRGGIDETRIVTPVVACDIPIELITDSSLNAFTTGDRIVVHSTFCGSLVPTRSSLLCSGMSSPMPISAIWTSNGPIKSWGGPVVPQSMPVWCSVEYRPVGYLHASSPAPGHWHSA